MKTEQVNLRLESDLIAALERAAAEEALDRGTMLRKLLLEALERRRLEVTLAKYQRGEVTLGRASEETGLTQWDLIDLLRARRIPYSLSPDEAETRLGRRLDRNPRVAESTAAGGEYSAAATLPDRPPARDGVLLVGINPAPASVRSGHYYQGRLGKRLWQRLERIGLLESAAPGREDEAFAAAGHGLTDVVKRATPSARELDPDELKRGSEELRAKIRLWSPRLVLFAFQEAAKAALGTRDVTAGACGELEGVPAFLLSGPYAPRAEAERIDAAVLEALKRGATPSEPAIHTQKITKSDIEGGRIRLGEEARKFFPAGRGELDVIVRGERLAARYDPRRGTGGRLAVLSVGKAALTRLVRPDERLRVQRGEDGLVRLG